MYLGFDLHGARDPNLARNLNKWRTTDTGLREAKLGYVDL